MAQITINIPDPHLDRVVEAIINLIAPGTPEEDMTPQAAKNMIIRFINEAVRNNDRRKLRAELESQLPEPPNIT